MNLKEREGAMPIFTLEESTYAGPIPEDGIFEAQCVSVTEITEKFTDKETGKPVVRMEFKFVIQDEGDWESTPVWGKTSKVFNEHENCKLKNWAEEILATELPVGFNLNTDDLVGNFCRVVIGQREYEKNAETKIANYVKDVLRSRSAVETTTDF
jgi:hypothetical protein